MALTLAGLLLVLGIAFISHRSAQNRAVRAEFDRIQAEAAAEAGLQDAYQKMAKSALFPPLADDSQGSFLYSEDLTDQAGRVVGRYHVTVDMRYANAPYWIVRISSRGIAGAPGDAEFESIVSAEIDVAPLERSSIYRARTPNPELFDILYTR